MSIANTCSLLRQWGSWAAGGGPAAFPRTCAMTRIKSGDRITSENVDPDVLRCNEIIRRASTSMRKILVTHYCSRGSSREKAEIMQLKRSTYYLRLNEAEWWAHTELETCEQDFAYCVSRIG